MVEREFGDVLWIFCAGEADGDLGEIRRVEEGNVLHGDVARVPVQSSEIGEQDVVGSKVTEGRPGGKS